MHITITGKDVAESIATEIGKTTGMACEVFTNKTSSVIIYDHTKAVARVTPLFDVIDVAPLCGPFVGHITDVPLAVSTFDDMREAASALDMATSHILNAALNR